MKRILYILLLLVLPLVAVSQPNASLKNVKISGGLTMTAMDRGFLVPRVTTAERDAISSPVEGLLVYNTDASEFQFFSGGWLTVGGDGVGDSSFVTLQVDSVFPFNNDTIAFDTMTWVLDGVNNRIGIGTIDPISKLTINVETVGGLYDGVRIIRAGFTTNLLASDDSDGGYLSLRSTAGVELVALNSNTSADFAITGKNFGVGTSSPATKFSVLGAINAGIGLYKTGNVLQGFLINRGSGGSLQLKNFAGSTDVVLLNGVTSGFIETGQNLGIGLSSSITAQLTVAGVNAASGTDAFLVEDNVGTDLMLIQNDGNIGIGADPGTSRLRVTGSGTGSGTFALSIANSSGSRFWIARDDSKIAIGGNTFDAATILTINDADNSSTGIAINNTNSGTSAQVGIAMEVNGIFGTLTLTPSNFSTTELQSSIRFTTVSSEVKQIALNTFEDGLFIYNNTAGIVPLGRWLQNGNLGIGTETASELLEVVGHVIVDSTLATTAKTTTLGVAATTFPVFSNVMTMTGDGGGNTIATITGANSGMVLTLIFVDANITLTDDNGHGANTLDLDGNISSLDDTTITIVYDGTSWYERSRSVN